MERNLQTDDLMKYLQDTYQFFKNEVEPPDDVNPFQMLQRRSKLSKELLLRCDDIIRSLCLDERNAQLEIVDHAERKTDFEDVYVEMGTEHPNRTCNPTVATLLSDLNHYLVMKPVAPKSVSGTTTNCKLRPASTSAPIPFSYFNFPAKEKVIKTNPENEGDTEKILQGLKSTDQKKFPDCPFTTLPASQLSNQTVRHKGSLTKIEKRLLFEQWKKLFCAIVEKWFLGYVKESASAPVIVLHLADLKILTNVDSKRFQIHSTTSGKRYTLEAESDAERTEWLKRLQDTVLNPLEIKPNLIVLATINSPARSSVKGLAPSRKKVSASKCEQTTVKKLLHAIPATLDPRRSRIDYLREHEYEVIGSSLLANNETKKNRCM